MGPLAGWHRLQVLSAGRHRLCGRGPGGCSLPQWDTCVHMQVMGAGPQGHMRVGRGCFLGRQHAPEGMGHAHLLPAAEPWRENSRCMQSPSLLLWGFLAPPTCHNCGCGSEKSLLSSCLGSSGWQGVGCVWGGIVPQPDCGVQSQLPTPLCASVSSSRRWDGGTCPHPPGSGRVKQDNTCKALSQERDMQRRAMIIFVTIAEITNKVNLRVTGWPFPGPRSEKDGGMLQAQFSQLNQSGCHGASHWGMRGQVHGGTQHWRACP